MSGKDFLRRARRLLSRLFSGDVSVKEFFASIWRYWRKSPVTASLLSYSQSQQDILFHLLFDGRPGVFVDVGARDGIVISNTYALEKHHGWTGVCIEPHPELYQALTTRRRSHNVNAAVADVEERGETLRFAMWKEGALGHSGLVDVDYRNIEELKDRAHQIVDVMCYPLRKILKDANLTRVDVLDIDVEGAETSVIRSIDFDQCHFNVISVEQGNEEIDRILTDAGFRLLCRIGTDSVYRNEEQREPAD